MPVVPRYSQVSEAVSELEAMHVSAVVESLKGTVASLTVVLAGVEQIEPREVDVGQGFDLGPKNSLDAVCVLGAAGPMMVGAQAVKVLVPMDSNWLGVEQEAVLGLLGPRVAELGLEFVMEAMYSLKVAVAAAVAEAVLKPKVVAAGLELGPVAMLDEEPDAVVAVPIELVVGVLAELVEPKEAGIVAAVVSPMVVDADPLFVMAVPMGAGAAAVFGLDSKLAAFAALEDVSRVADTVAGDMVALEADSKIVELEGSSYLWEVEPVLGSVEADVSPKVAVVGTDLEVVPVAALDSDAMNWWVAVVGLVFALQTSLPQEHAQAAAEAAG